MYHTNWGLFEAKKGWDSKVKPQAYSHNRTGPYHPWSPGFTGFTRFFYGQALLVAKPDAVFAYDPDEGNMSAMPLDGQKLLLEQFKSYFVAGSPRSHVAGSLGVSKSRHGKKMTIQTLRWTMLDVTPFL